MSATLDYDIKKCMGLLCKDSRWNVLTVLILHANVRNRCYVGMDTIAEMATAGNVNKATRVKKWLSAHGAFELVPHDKRVAEECNLPQRQHVYQLTGVLKSCADLDCDCHTILKVERHYLHYAKEVISEDNFKEDSANEVIAGDNFNRGKVIPVENINGDNLSTTNTSNKDKEIAPAVADAPALALVERPTVPEPKVKRTVKPKESTIPAAQMNPMKDAIVAVFKWDWERMTDNEIGTVQTAAKQLCKAGRTPEDVPIIYRYCVKKGWEGFKPTALTGAASEALKHRSPVSVTQALNHESEAAPITINQFVRKPAESNHVA